MGGINNVTHEDLGYPAITCKVYYQKMKHAFCDLGASVNLMSKAMFEQLDIQLSLSLQP
jgi:hypothetical protein